VGVWIWRGIEGMAWTDYVTGDGVLERVQEGRRLINLIKERQAGWIGHVVRGGALLKDILEGGTEGEKQGGRPGRRTLDWMVERDGGRTCRELGGMAQC